MSLNARELRLLQFLMQQVGMLPETILNHKIYIYYIYCFISKQIFILSSYFITYTIVTIGLFQIWKNFVFMNAIYTVYA